MERPRFESFGEPSTEYWLQNCRGFGVRSNSGHKLGVVLDVLFQTRSDCPDYLVVRRGFVRKQHERIAVDAVVALEPAERRIVVRDAAESRGGS